MSPDGTKPVYSKGRRIANIWRAPLHPDRPASWRDAEQITFDQALVEFVDVSPDGDRILFSGSHDIWRMDLEGGEVLQVTRDPAGDWHPRWSPDGNRLAFTSARDGNARQLSVIPADGGDASPVPMDVVSTALFSDWSPDVSQLLFGSSRAVFAVDAEGGATRRLVQSGSQARWSRDGTRIYFKGLDERSANVWEARPDGSGARPLTDLAGRPGLLGYEPPTSDGRFLYFIWVEDLGDIWVMDVVTDEDS